MVDTPGLDAGRPLALTPEEVRVILWLRSVAHGQVQVILQDHRIVRTEVTHKHKLA